MTPFFCIFLTRIEREIDGLFGPCNTLLALGEELCKLGKSGFEEMHIPCILNTTEYLKRQS
jgi:hypothetical protein